MKVPKFPKIPGCRLYLVGGCVRDLLMGLSPKDLDFVVVTNHTFKELLEVIAAEGGEVFLAKPEFMTIRARIDGQVVDLVYPRTETGYADGRHPDLVDKAKSLEEDSKRRDFTVNAMYMTEEGGIIDFHGGQGDLKERCIRCVGNPDERFEEDYLRILRGIRFAVKPTFHIDSRTKMAMFKHVSNVPEKVSQERIREEINKALHINPHMTLEYLYEIYPKFMMELREIGLNLELTAKQR